MFSTSLDRRKFLRNSAYCSAAMAGLASFGFNKELFADDDKEAFKISLAQWSLHKSFFGKQLDPMDFAKIAKTEYDITGIEYVNQFYSGKGEDKKTLQDLKTRAEDHGVQSLLIMVDGEGELGNKDDAERKKAVENHYKWVEAAKFLGCHSIRVNAATKADFEEGMKLAADGLRKLSEFAAPMEINVIVENHGGLSSNGEWLAKTIRMTEMPNCGTLPDFGNFYEYDRYQGVTDLMPLAKAVSAKSYDFNAEGNETKIDFQKMIDIVMEAGYHGYIGVEYEGSRLDEAAGIRATRDLLIKCRENVHAHS